MIRARGLTRDFVVKKEIVHAVRGIDLEVRPGELVALLGPNGAGKSTTLRMLTTLLPPTAGTATVAGHDITTDPDGVRRRIGYIGQGNGAGHNWRVRDELIMQGRFYDMRKDAAAARADELMAGLGLTDLAKRTVLTLSGGQKRRLDVAMGLMHRPPLLFLDEPSTGMDPQNRANLWEHLLGLREQGTTIVLTTHYLEEADTFAERVVIIDHGAVIADDTAADLKSRLAGDRVAVTVPAGDADEAVRIAAGHGADLEHVRHAGEVRIGLRTDRGSRVLPALITALVSAGIPVSDAGLTVPTLDDVFLNLTGRSLREDSATPEPPPDATGQTAAPTGKAVTV